VRKEKPSNRPGNGDTIIRDWSSLCEKNGEKTGWKSHAPKYEAHQREEVEIEKRDKKRQEASRYAHDNNADKQTAALSPLIIVLVLLSLEPQHRNIPKSFLGHPGSTGHGERGS
jgi:hypothetical protein